MNRYQNIFFETVNGNTYYLDEINSKYYYFHPLLSFLTQRTIEDDDFLNLIQYPLEFQNHKYNKEEVLYYYNKIHFLITHKVISNKQRGIFYNNIKKEDIEDAIANTESLVIEMTQKCNLRCVYCAYGELYNRDSFRNNKDIDIKKIETLIAFLHENYWNTNKNHSVQKRININFYGGEPLLRFKEIKKIVSLIESLRNDKIQFSYAMTTNATLINKEIADFLAKYEFEIGISIDGNEMNNSYRIFPNGQNSYNIIINKIEYMKEHYPKYFANKVVFMSVLHNRNSRADIHTYLENRYHKIVSVGPLNPDCIRDDQLDVYKEMVNPISMDEDKFSDYIFKKDIINAFEHYNQYAVSSYAEFFIAKNNKRFPTGTCIPLKKKIFITSDHLLLPCEKINFKYNFGKINIDKISFDKTISNVAKQHSSYLNQIKQQCRLCYHNQICNKCIFHLRKDNEGNFDCQHFYTKKKFSELLAKYWGRIEDDPNLLRDEIVSNFIKL